jgi:predicted amidophosphoribosyltransferase
MDTTMLLCRRCGHPAEPVPEAGFLCLGCGLPTVQCLCAAGGAMPQPDDALIPAAAWPSEGATDA